jgi:hypothetical protein
VVFCSEFNINGLLQLRINYNLSYYLGSFVQQATATGSYIDWSVGSLIGFHFFVYLDDNPRTALQNLLLEFVVIISVIRNV